MVPRSLFCLAVAAIGLSLTQMGCTAEEVRQPPPEPTAKELLTVEGAHDLDLGKGNLAWCWDMRGEGVEAIKLELLLVADGKVQNLAVGEYTNLPAKFKVRVHALIVGGNAFGEGTKKTAMMGATFKPMCEGRWQRQSPALAIKTLDEKKTDDPDDPKVLKETAVYYTSEGGITAGQVLKLLQVGLSPRPKAIPPGFGGGPWVMLDSPRGLDFWKEFTAKNPDAILMAIVTCVEARAEGASAPTPSQAPRLGQ